MSSPKNSAHGESFVYRCSGKIIEFIQRNPQYHNDIRSNIGKSATLNNISESKGVGKVAVTFRPQVYGAKHQTIEALDNFFNKFSSSTFQISANIHLIRRNLETYNQDCQITWNFSQNSVTVTGRLTDVDNFTNMLYEICPQAVAMPTKNMQRSKSMTDLSPSKMSMAPQTSGSRCRWVYNAPDKNVLNFITSYHVYFKQLEERCLPFGRVELSVEESKVFVFRNKHDDSIRRRCFTLIGSFLNDFASATAHFDIMKLKALYSEKKELFKNSQTLGYPQVVASFDQDGVLTVCGERHLVPGQMEVLTNYLRTAGHWNNLTKQKSSPIAKNQQKVTKSHPKAFIYKRKNETFLETLKFLAVNETAKTELHKCISNFETYEFLPNLKNPESLSVKSSQSTDLINKRLNDFFSNYTCESRSYNQQQLTEAREKFASVFDSLTHLGVYVRWVNAPTILIVGQKDKVAAAFSLIEGVVKNIVPSQPNSTSDDQAQNNNAFVYQKAAPAFPAILKFVLRDKEETQKLRQALKGVAFYEAIPDIKQPTGLKLNPVPSLTEPFFPKIGPIMKKFFSEYSYTQRVYEAQRVKTAKQKITGPFWTMQQPHTFSVWNNNTFIVVGVDEYVQIFLKMMDDVIKTSGGPSTSETTTKKKTPEPTAEKIEYHPLNKDKDNLLFIMKYSTLKSKLNETCKGLCTVSGKKVPLNLAPTQSPIQNKAGFLQQVTKKIQAFVCQFVMEKIELGPEDLKTLKSNQPKWLGDLRQDKAKAVGIQLGDDNICVGGLAQDVEDVCDVIKQHVGSSNKRKPCSKDICRILINCEVIKQVNEMFAGAVEVSCSLEKELVEFKGDSRCIQAAEEQISSMKLIERSPQMNELKLELLKVLIKKENKKYVDIIYQQFSEESVRGALVIREDEVILVATDGKDFTHGSSLLERIIHMNLVTVPTNAQQDATQDLVENMSQSSEIIVREKDNIIWIVGVDENEVDRTTALLKTFFNHSKNVILNHACDVKVAQFVAKHHSTDTNFPQGVNVNVVKFGLQLLGPPSNAHKALKHLQSLNCSTETITFCEQGLHKYFSSDQWIAYVSYVEKNARCSINVLLGTSANGESPVFEERPPPSPSRRMGRMSLSEETHYADIRVLVCNNDITKDASEAIVNGCTPDFNLSRGPLSKAILDKAGKGMQNECNKNPVGKTSVLRVTNAFGKLECKYVIHLVTPRSIKEYCTRVRSALDYAAVLGCSSVAVPTLGCGRIGLKEDEIASSMAKAIREFSNSGQKSVKMIKIVVFDKKLWSIFENAILQGKTSAGETSVESATLVKQLAADCNPKKCNDTAKVELTYEELWSYEQGKLMIETHVKQAIDKKTINDAAISKFTPSEWIDVYQFAMANNVSVLKQSTGIKVSGSTLNVGNMNDFVKKIILELHEAETLAKSCVWKWTKQQNTFQDFPPRISLTVERLFKRNSTASQTLAFEGSEIKLNFSSMEYTFKETHGRIKRVVISGEGLPSNWVDLGGRPWAKVFVKRESQEFEMVQKKFIASNPLYQILIKVERIQNPALYQQYLLKKNDVARRMTTKNPVEKELFHGTSEEDAEKICAHGFDRGFAGKNATLFGKGSYFAVDSSFSAAYASGSTHLSYMFLANVITGDYCRGSPDLKAPPAKPGPSNSNQLYDSVVDDAKRPRIFVVFKDSSVYPSYLITYK